jgi:CopG family transcriptional regulator, nickel-responsive regulator
MSDIARFGVSIPTDLLGEFDKLIECQGYGNRSEAVRDLIREKLLTEEIHTGQDVVASIALVYDHHTRGLTEKLTEMQHKYPTNIVSSMHIHISHHNCLEVIIIKGNAGEIQQLSDLMVATRGVRHGKCTIIAPLT